MVTEELKELFNKIITHSQYSIPNPQTDDLFTRWEENKRWMYEGFMEKKLIRNLGMVSFDLSDVDKEDRLEGFKNLAADYSNDLAVFLDTVGYKDFYNNILSEEYYLTADKVIPVGTKVIKAFKFFIEDVDVRRYVQDKASELIQENKVEGELCISIHPLDFLTSSENTLKWRSCHSLDGEYRAGNLSYIVDNVTFITYLKTKNDIVLHCCPEDTKWNNKKWRCLMFANKDILGHPNLIFAGRQYPFELPNILNTIRDAIEASIPYIQQWMPWTQEKIDKIPLASGEPFYLKEEVYPIGGYLYSAVRLVANAKNSRNYNDLLYSSCYTPYYTWNKKRYWDFTPTTQMTIGGEIKCLRCGERVITTGDTMMCKECECEYGNSDSDEYLRCDCCENRMHRSDFWYVDDYEVCQNCYETLPKCKICGAFRMPHNINNDICIWCSDTEEEEKENGC